MAPKEWRDLAKIYSSKQIGACRKNFEKSIKRLESKNFSSEVKEAFEIIDSLIEEYVQIIK